MLNACFSSNIITRAQCLDSAFAAPDSVAALAVAVIAAAIFATATFRKI